MRRRARVLAVVGVCVGLFLNACGTLRACTEIGGLDGDGFVSASLTMTGRA